jgi:hypothetical protein
MAEDTNFTTADITYIKRHYRTLDEPGPRRDPC